MRVDWDLDRNVSEVEGFTILRGQTPWSMEPIASVDESDRDYEDRDAIWRGNPVWYRIVAVDGDGKRVASSPPVSILPPS